MTRSKTVLMIDDDIEDQEIFSDVLKGIDPEIQCVLYPGATEALDLLEQGSQLPDWIFVDLNMPVMNGFEFLTAVKKSTALRSIPVVIYTTSNDQAHKAKARSLGAFSFITKPPDPVLLRNQLLALLMMDHVDSH
jgi:CheY-like chemotaxis protein